MRWKKLGLLYNPSILSYKHPKLISHAANPLPVHLSNNAYRIFFSGRDEYNRSSIGAVDIDIEKQCIIKMHNQPFFEHGSAETFYADGVSIGNCYESDGLQYMLFMGWQTPKNSHWRGDIGRLIVRSDLSLKLDNTVPFMSIDTTDPISLSYPWVIKNNTKDYSMWYGSTKIWDTGNGEMLHVINHATSENGHFWRREGLSIPYQLGVAQAFSRPTVVKNGINSYQMWYSYRGISGLTYRIGYAESNDGKNWIRMDELAGIDVSESGWDSEMICYPFVFDHKGSRYMLYNGNSYGRTGFGLAILEN